MAINIFILKGELNGKIVVVRFFYCRVYHNQNPADTIVATLIIFYEVQNQQHNVIIYLYKKF